MAKPEKKMDIDVSLNFTPMSEAAVGIHETFMSYVDAGFTREEALSLVRDMIKLAWGNN